MILPFATSDMVSTKNHLSPISSSSITGSSGTKTIDRENGKTHGDLPVAPGGTTNEELPFAYLSNSGPDWMNGKYP